MARLSIRIDLDGDDRLGPGKVLLLERIAQHGSISAAGRSLKMSYRRAWELVAAVNGSFREPLVSAQMGGRHGGGASLTPLGAALVEHYRAIEREAADAVEPRLRALQEAAGARDLKPRAAVPDSTMLAEEENRRGRRPRHAGNEADLSQHASRRQAGEQLPLAARVDADIDRPVDHDEAGAARAALREDDGVLRNVPPADGARGARTADRSLEPGSAGRWRRRGERADPGRSPDRSG